MLFLLLAAVVVSGKVRWLIRSEKGYATYYMHSAGNALDQIRVTHSVLYFTHGKDTVWFDGPENLYKETGTLVPIRYQPDHPSDVKVDNLLGIWGSSLVFGGVPLLTLLIVALHPHIIPYRARFHLMARKPFIRVINGEE